MRKICSITLALLLLMSAMFIIPATTAMADDSLLDVSIDFSDSFYTSAELDTDTYKKDDVYVAAKAIGDASSWDANADEQYTVIPVAEKMAWPPVFLLSDSNGNKLLLETGAKYRITFKAKIPTAPSEAVELHLNDNTSTGNAKKSVCLLSTSSAITEWTEYSVDFTSYNNNNGIMISYWAVNSGINTADINAPIYIDDIRIMQMATVNYGAGSVSACTYEEALAKIPYATALYLDAAKTQPATGAINSVEVTVYPTFDYSTTIDFTEKIYEGTPDASVQYTCSFVDDPDAETVAEHGKVAKIGGTGKLWASPKWAPGFRFADLSGTGIYNVKSNVKYHITFDYKVDKSAIPFNILLRATNTSNIGNNLVENNKVTVYTASAAVTESTGWRHYDSNFTVSADGYLMLCAMATDNTNDTTVEIYIDNITVTPLPTITYNGTSISADPNATYESLKLASKPHTAWYLDEACTKPAVGQIGNNNVTLYSKYSAATEVDFSEAVYVNGTANSLVYATVANDETNGNYIKFTKLSSGVGGDTADNWAQAVRIADTTGGGYFAVEKGKTYTFTYDYKVAAVGTSNIPSDGKFGFCVQITDGGLSDVYLDNRNDTSIKLNHTMPKSENLVAGDWVNNNSYTFVAAESGYVVITVRGYYKWSNSSNTTIYLDNVKIAQVMATAPSEAGLFSTTDTDANTAAGITGTEGSAVYTDNGTEYAAFRVFGEYIAPANADGTGADTTKIMKADGTTATIESRHMLLGYKTTPKLDNNYAMSTAEGEKLANYWSVSANDDGTYTVRYSLLLKNIPENYQGVAFNARGAIVTTDGETIYTNTQVDISAKALYNKAVTTNTELKWFGGVAGAVE